jgi:hypothetical protein
VSARLCLRAVTIIYLSQTHTHTHTSAATHTRSNVVPKNYTMAKTYRMMAEAGRESLGSGRGAHARVCVRVRMLWMSGEVTLLPANLSKKGWLERRAKVMTHSPGCACVPPDAHSLVGRVDTTESRVTSSRIDGRVPAQSRTRRPPQGDSELCLSVAVRDKKTHDTHTHTHTHAQLLHIHTLNQPTLECIVCSTCRSNDGGDFSLSPSTHTHTHVPPAHTAATRTQRYSRKIRFQNAMKNRNVFHQPKLKSQALGTALPTQPTTPTLGECWPSVGAARAVCELQRCHVSFFARSMAMAEPLCVHAGARCVCVCVCERMSSDEPNKLYET